jgi:hypothetical protein
MACAVFPDTAMLWDILSHSLPGAMPGPTGYPPIFAIWMRSGGLLKSMYSKSAGISETIAEN